MDYLDVFIGLFLLRRRYDRRRRRHCDRRRHHRSFSCCCFPGSCWLVRNFHCGYCH